ncbi:hypothetical protein [Parvularcula sp. LCG005]|uniref:hypothetical protein n=1 Tax=Parvularcula sp. LCG005 TaxID=3078805 RepID=UPI0029423969|nr:hypothetical protein [Parvularcula sp. LCG005]WOI54280.1 hypothetical protein RUI03_04590 [Parvularcula sp. LCG005]
MRFCVVWSDGMGRLAPVRQRERFADLGVIERNIVEDWGDLPPLRSGDMVTVCTPLALAPDVMTLTLRYRGVMRANGAIEIDGIGSFADWDSFPEALEAYETARRRRQTANARAKAKPQRGPRDLKTKADREAFAKLWRDPTVRKSELAAKYGRDWTTINRWGKALKLGEKAKPE